MKDHKPIKEIRFTHSGSLWIAQKFNFLLSQGNGIFFMKDKEMLSANGTSDNIFQVLRWDVSPELFKYLWLRKKLTKALELELMMFDRALFPIVMSYLS